MTFTNPDTNSPFQNQDIPHLEIKIFLSLNGFYHFFIHSLISLIIIQTLIRFIHVQTNVSVGRVRILRLNKSTLETWPVCQCVKSAPCVDDRCLNRQLRIECDKRICPAGALCQNQQFQLASCNFLYKSDKAEKSEKSEKPGMAERSVPAVAVPAARACADRRMCRTRRWSTICRLHLRRWPVRGRATRTPRRRRAGST